MAASMESTIHILLRKVIHTQIVWHEALFTVAKKNKMPRRDRFMDRFVIMPNIYSITRQISIFAI